MGLVQTLVETWLGAPRATEPTPFTLNSDLALALFGEPATTTGVRVTAETALSCSAWWRGINLVAGRCAAVPLWIYRRNGEGKDRERSVRSNLLRYAANPLMTAFQWRLLMFGNAVSRGNGYSYIYRGRGAEPLELWWLDPACTYPDVDPDGALWYVTRINNEDRKLSPADVIHFRGYGDGIQGYPVFQKAREAIGLGLATEKHSANTFSKGARPGVVLEMEGRMSKEESEQFRQQWEHMHAGLDNTHRTAILMGGMKAKAISFNNEDAQLLQTREFQIREIANFLGVPPHKLGDNSRTAYASLEEENQSMIDDCLDIWMNNAEQELRMKVLTEREKEEDTHVIEFLREALVRANLEAQGNYAQKALAGRAWMTPDEQRSKINLNPLGGDAARYKDEPDTAQNEDEGKAGRGGTEASLPLRALRIQIEDAGRRIVRRIGTEARRKAKEPAAYCAWLDGLVEDHLGPCAEILAPSLAALAILTGKSGSVQDETRRVLDDLYYALSGDAEAYTPEQLPGAIEKHLSILAESIPRKLANCLLGGEP